MEIVRVPADGKFGSAALERRQHHYDRRGDQQVGREKQYPSSVPHGTFPQQGCCAGSVPEGFLSLSIPDVMVKRGR